jgi:hypothetical protein
MIYPVKKTLSLWNPKMLSHIPLCTQRHLNYFGFSIFWLTAYLIKVIPETHRTWWRSFQKRIVPDEGYSRNASYLMKVIPETYLMKVIPEMYRSWWRSFQKRTWWRLFQKRTWWRLFQKRTWWRFFQKRIVRTKFDIYVSFTAIGHLKLNERQNMFIKWDFLQEKSYTRVCVFDFQKQ